MKEILEALVKFCTEPPHQWHPWIIHFPIVLLVLEAGSTALFWKTSDPRHASWSMNFLTGALIMMTLAIFAGVHDCGLDLGPGNRFWLGLQDRWNNAFLFRSSVTVHTWLAVFLFTLTLVRLIWRHWQNETALRPPLAYAYGILLFLNLWLLVAAANAGGMLNHH